MHGRGEKAKQPSHGWSLSIPSVSTLVAWRQPQGFSALQGFLSQSPVGRNALCTLAPLRAMFLSCSTSSGMIVLVFHGAPSLGATGGTG